MLIMILFILGLCMGSFINAWVWRVKTKRPILNDRSMCPKCKHVLGVFDLIPVASWLGLGGKCRYCKKPISAQYPAVEILGGVLFSLSYIALSPTLLAEWVVLALWLGSLTVLIALCVYDIRWMLLPNKMMIILAILSLAMLLTKGILSGDPNIVLNGALAAVLSGGFFYLLFAISKGKWMGGGDVKLAFIMGLLLGLQNVLLGLFIGFNTAAIYSLGLMATGKLSRKSLIPFGPFLIFGTIVAMLYGEPIIDWYKQVFFL